MEQLPYSTLVPGEVAHGHMDNDRADDLKSMRAKYTDHLKKQLVNYFLSNFKFKYQEYIFVIIYEHNNMFSVVLRHYLKFYCSDCH